MLSKLHADGVVSDLGSNLFRNASGAATKAAAVANRYSERIGELGAGFVAQSLGFSAVKFKKLGNSTHGIDGIFKDPKTGQFLILEAKGAGGRLEGTQMSQRWILDSLKKVYPPELADELSRAANDGKLLGGVARTDYSSYEVYDPTYIIKQWGQIGRNEF